MKKILSIFLVLALVLCMVPFAGANDYDDVFIAPDDPMLSDDEFSDNSDSSEDDEIISAETHAEPSADDGGDGFTPTSSYDDAPFELDQVIIKLATDVIMPFSRNLDFGIEFTESVVLNPSLGINRRDAGTFSTSSVTETNNNMLALTLKETGVEAVENAIAILNASPMVEYAQPSYLYKPLTEPPILEPNDPSYSGTNKWGLENIKAPQAWYITQGSKDVVVGVIDTGIRGTHQDLKDNLWDNPNPNRGDFVNDIHGYDFANSVLVPPTDLHGHGTHVAGIVGAKGNNSVGITGVNWNISIAWLRVADDSGGMNTGTITQAVNYANEHNIPILNASLGGQGEDKALREAIAKYKGLFVAAAGNNFQGDEWNDGLNKPRYPAAWDLPNIISVASIMSNDALAPTSNTSSSVDIAAPGQPIYSTSHTNDTSYRTDGGTSMAAPHVAGAAALILAHNPGFNTVQLRYALLSTTRSVSAHNFGILNAYAAVTTVMTPPSVPRNLTAMPGNRQVSLSWSAPSNSGSSAISGYQVSMDGGSTWVSASSNTGHTFTGLINSVSYNFRVRAVSLAGNGSVASISAMPGNKAIIDFIVRLYNDVHERTPGPTEVDYYVYYLQSGIITGAETAYGFFFSPEMINRNLPANEYVNRLYNSLHGRTAGSSEIDYWLARLEAGYFREDLLYGFVMSNEFEMRCNAAGITRGSYTPPPIGAIRAFVIRLYKECHNRIYPSEVGESEVNFYVNNLLQGRTTGTEVAHGFFFSPEFLRNNPDNETYINILYRAMLDRPGEPEGIAFYLTNMSNHGVTRLEVFFGFADSSEFAGICARYGIRR